MTAAVSSLTVAALKAEGVELFRQKKYNDASKKFTLAIDLDEAGCDELKAQCHNNRAAAREHVGGSSRSTLIADMNEAIRLMPDYGKAYARRYRYHMENSQWKEAHADLYAALHLNALVYNGVVTLEMAMCMQHLIEQRMQQWKQDISQNDGERPIPVKHEKVSRWLETGRDDGLLKDAHKYSTGGLRNEGAYSQVLKMLSEKKYDDIDTFIQKKKDSLGDRAAESWLLAARILAYKCSWKKSGECLSRAAPLIVALPNGERKRGLRIASHVIRIESSLTPETVKRAFRAALVFSPDTPDFYFHAGNRLVAVDDIAGAREIIHDKRVDNITAIQMQRIGLIIAMLPSKPNPTDYEKIQQILHNVECMLRASDLPCYLTRMLAAAFFATGQAARAVSLLREIAERADDSTLWNDLGGFVSQFSKTECCAAFRRSQVIEPFSHSANMNYVMDALKEHRMALFKRSVSSSLLTSIERALTAFDPSRDVKQLEMAFMQHETIKAKIRAAEMIGYGED